MMWFSIMQGLSSTYRAIWALLAERNGGKSSDGVTMWSQLASNGHIDRVTGDVAGSVCLAGSLWWMNVYHCAPCLPSSLHSSPSIIPNLIKIHKPPPNTIFLCRARITQDIAELFVLRGFINSFNWCGLYKSSNCNLKMSGRVFSRPRGETARGQYNTCPAATAPPIQPLFPSPSFTVCW